MSDEATARRKAVAGRAQRPEASKPTPAIEADSELRLRAIVDNAVDGIITINEQGVIETVNPATQAIFGYEAEELVGQNVKVLMPEPYHAEHDQYLRNYRQTAQRKIIGIGREVVGRRKDGTVFPLDLSVSEVQLGSRRLFTGIIREISERKRIEEERQKFVSLVENSSDFIAMASLSWQILYINKAGQTLLGVTAEDAAGLEVLDFWHEQTLPIVLEQVLPAQKKGESFRFQGQVKHRVTGEAIDVDCNTFAIRDPQTAEMLAIAFSLRDIREQKRAEQALRDSEARIKAVLESAVDGIITINERGAIESLNPAALGIFGYSPEEVVGQNVKLLMPEPYHGEHDQYLRNYRHTGQRKIIGIGREVVGRRKDGSAFPLDLSVSEVQLGDRRLFTGLIRDITERKQAESHRNLLVAELSHRVKNTLTTIISVAQQSFRRAASVEDARTSFEGRVRALAQTHSRLAETNWSGASLRVVIEDEIAPYLHDDRANISLTGPDVMFGPKAVVSLGMAFHELATNAAKHGALSTKDGTVEVQWDRLGDQVRIRWTERGGPEVKPPERSGFGRMLLERGLAVDLGGKVQLGFEPGGLKCTMVFSLPNQRGGG